MPRNDLIQWRRGTAAQWTTANSLLKAGEPGVETDTLRVKVGNGVSYWNDLPYVAVDEGLLEATIENALVEPTSATAWLARNPGPHILPAARLAFFNRPNTAWASLPATFDTGQPISRNDSGSANNRPTIAGGKYKLGRGTGSGVSTIYDEIDAGVGNVLRRIGFRFVVDPTGASTSGWLAGFAMSNASHILEGGSTYRMGVHVSFNSVKCDITKVSNADSPGAFIFTDLTGTSGINFKSPLVADGITEYWVEGWITPNNTFVIVLPDGQRFETVADPEITSWSTRYGFFQSVLTERSTDQIPAVKEVWFDTGTQYPPGNGAPVTRNALDPYALLTDVMPPPRTHLVDTGYYEGPDKMVIPRKPAMVLLGDSFLANVYRRTDWNGSSLSRTAAFMGDGFVNQAMTWNNQPCTWWSFGVGGSTSADAITMFDTQILPLTYEPQIVFIHTGNNDVAAGATASAIFTNLLTLCRKSWAIGAHVILCNAVTRATSTDAQEKVVFALNQMIANFAAANPTRVTVLDMWSIMGDPLTGEPKTSMVVDGVHPTTLACWLIGKELEPILDRLVQNKANPLAQSASNDDTNIIVGSAGMLTGSGGFTFPNNGIVGPVATGWYANTSGTDANMLATYSKVAAADGFGDWQQIAITTVPSSAYAATLFTTANTGFAPGDIVRAAVRFETDAAGWGNGIFDLLVSAYNSGSGVYYHKVSANQAPSGEGLIATRPESGLLVTPPFTIPDSVDTLQIAMTKGNLGTVRWGRPSLRKLNKIAF